MKLMEICGLDMKEAYELYIDSGYNFEVTPNPLRPQSIKDSIPSQLSQIQSRSINNSMYL